MAARALLLLAAALPALAGGGAGGAGGAAFVGGQQRAVRGRAGGAATLECQVLAAAQVSWVRARDLQILAHAGAAFTADVRVSAGARALRPAAGTAHVLRITPLRASDAGLYECQLNTEPKTSLLFNLTVTDGPEPDVLIRAWAEDAAAGALRCEARYAAPADTADATAPLALRWLHAGQPVDLEAGADGADGAGGAASLLSLGAARARSGGRYTCAALGAAGGGDVLAAAHVDLDQHVSGAESDMEAMQRDQSAGAGGAGSAGSAGGPAARAALLVLLALASRAP